MVANCTLGYMVTRPQGQRSLNELSFFSGKYLCGFNILKYHKRIKNKPGLTNIRWGKKRDNSLPNRG